MRYTDKYTNKNTNYNSLDTQKKIPHNELILNLDPELVIDYKVVTSFYVNKTCTYQRILRQLIDYCLLFEILAKIWSIVANFQLVF